MKIKMRTTQFISKFQAIYKDPRKRGKKCTKSYLIKDLEQYQSIINSVSIF